MSPQQPQEFGDYLVFVDESGDHSLTRTDPIYSVFVLAFVLVRKSDYIGNITPDLQRFKMRYWGHDETVLHEHEIRKPRDDFSFLMQKPVREQFVAELSDLMAALPATIVAVVIDKPAFARHHSPEAGAYDHAMEAGLNVVYQYLTELGQGERTTPSSSSAAGAGKTSTSSYPSGVFAIPATPTAAVSRWTSSWSRRRRTPPASSSPIWSPARSASTTCVRPSPIARLKSSTPSCTAARRDSSTGGA